MIQLFRLLSRALGRLLDWLGLRVSNGLSRDQQENLYSSMGDKEELLSPLEESGGYRKRVTHVVGPLASSDGFAWDEEEIAYMGENAVQREVIHRQVRRCDCGSVLAYGNSILGTCAICSRITCGKKGCSERCEYCGNIICARHAVKYRDHTFCSRHRMYAWLLIFWGCLE